MTPIERWLWADIRHADAVFYPQYPVGNFFVDFANPTREKSPGALLLERICANHSVSRIDRQSKEEGCFSASHYMDNVKKMFAYG